jgi:hypothetical protein
MAAMGSRKCDGSESERMPGYLNKSQAPPIASCPSRIVKLSQNAAEVCPLRLGSNVAFQHDLNRDTPGSQWQRRNGFEAWR